MRSGNSSKSTSSTYHAASAASTREQHLALFTLIFSVAEMAVAVWCLFQQMTTTHDSLFGLLQGGTIVPSHMSADEALKVFQGNEGKDNVISWTVAYVTQIMFLSWFIPGTPLHNNPKLSRIVLAIFFVLEVTSDLWYSVATGTTLLGAFTWIFSWSNGGWLVALAYITAMAAGSTLLLIDGFHRFERLFKTLIGRA